MSAHFTVLQKDLGSQARLGRLLTAHGEVETKGLPEPLLRANAERLLTIPMCGSRSLNLATAVAIVLFEAVRQVTDNE